MQRFALIAALLVSSAFAAEPVKHSCTQPEHPGKSASQLRMDAFNRQSKVYGDCMKKFIDEQAAIADRAAEAGNGAIKEYNEFVKKVNAVNSDN